MQQPITLTFYPTTATRRRLAWAKARSWFPAFFIGGCLGVLAWKALEVYVVYKVLGGPV